MRLMIMLTCALVLASCGVNRNGVVVLPPDAPRLDRPDSRSMQDCSWPEAVKSITLTQQQAEGLIGRNADRLIDCFKRHRILANYIRKRDSGLTGRG